MAAYLIANMSAVSDPETFKKYQAEVPAMIERMGGKYLVRGGEHETVEGDWNPLRVVVIEFPNMKTLKRWYNSDEYQKIVKFRQDTTEGSLIFIEGI